MTYDRNGNTLSDGTNAYTWDARNRLVSADNNGASFSYDPLGRRASKSLLSSTTSFLYDGANAVQEQSGGTVTANMLTGGVDEHFLRTDSTGSFSFLTDALGSSVALTDSTGTSVQQYSYSPYGVLSATGSNTNEFTYTGRESGDGLGIDYYRARYYNPQTGRFLSEDPIGFRGGINIYAYVGNDPLDFVDPFGMDKGPQGCNSADPNCAPNNPTPTPTPHQREQQQKDKVGHGCTIAGGLLILGDAAIMFSGQEYLAPWALSLNIHVAAVCGWATW